MIVVEIMPRLFAGDYEAALKFSSSSGSEGELHVLSVGVMPFGVPNWCTAAASADANAKSSQEDSGGNRPASITNVHVDELCAAPTGNTNESNSQSGTRKLTHLFLPVEDVPSANIIQHFDRAVQFIKCALHNTSDNELTQQAPVLTEDLAATRTERRPPRVLVHCWAGQSRSITICLAYMMRISGDSAARCLEIAKASFPDASPNWGFMRQLDMYEKMGFKLQGDSPAHLYFRAISRGHMSISTPMFLDDFVHEERANTERSAYACR
eukprot:GHVT01045025.1.p1 GENE.GHVT01045025.1~~GHVT01045025.1.p1  ORF type:complete len:268 (+),score=17.63 GHVT01045025.1:322-1125(+)